MPSAQESADAMRRPLRVAVIDDHLVTTRGVLDVLGEAFDVAETLRAEHVSEVLADDGHFDFVVLDLRLEDGSDPSSNVRLLQGRGWPVLLYTQGSSVEMARCIRAGVSAIVTKSEPLEHLVEAATALLGGQPYLSRTWAEALQASESLPHLSPRKAEVLRLYAAGLTAKDVAAQLFLAPDTVKDYLAEIRASFPGEDVRTKTQLANAAVKYGFADPTSGSR